MKTKNKNKKIAELILRAQQSSDGGKNNYVEFGNKKSKRDYKARYAVKDCRIFAAMELIRTGNTNFRYSVTIDKELEMYLVYFETRIFGKKYQVSFHSYNENLKKFIKNSFRMKWDKKISRVAAETIYRYYCPNGLYLSSEDY